MTWRSEIRAYTVHIFNCLSRMRVHSLLKRNDVRHWKKMNEKKHTCMRARNYKTFVADWVKMTKRRRKIKSVKMPSKNENMKKKTLDGAVAPVNAKNCIVSIITIWNHRCCIVKIAQRQINTLTHTQEKKWKNELCVSINIEQIIRHWNRA